MMKSTIQSYIKDIDDRLIDLIPDFEGRQQIVSDAMKYSITAGGKRLRPVFFLEFYKLCGGKDIDLALNYACALEMIHTYSLIHDDLPCMDDDDYRRGRPSCHKAFDYATALLAGDALLNRAFEVMSADFKDPLAQIKAISYISTCSGITGMIGGQGIDVCNNKILSDISELEHMVSLKTGALINAACVGGCLLAGADEKLIEIVKDYSVRIGLAFQIRDDLLDEIGDQTKLGKQIGSDSKQNKTTFFSVYGEEGCKKIIHDLTVEALDYLSKLGSCDFIVSLTNWLVGREY